jgi:mannose-6-phosphate isomerase-like protein (cupin superfamily)
MPCCVRHGRFVGEGEIEVGKKSPLMPGKFGNMYQMPEDIRIGRDEEKKAWASGLFAAISSVDAYETKDITVSNAGKVYERLEIHDRSPQMYLVLKGKVEIPASETLDGEKAICAVSEGEAIILNPKTWHGGASGIDVPASVFVVLDEGTTQNDTRKVNLRVPFKLGPR